MANVTMKPKFLGTMAATTMLISFALVGACSDETTRREGDGSLVGKDFSQDAATLADGLKEDSGGDATRKDAPPPISDGAGKADGPTAKDDPSCPGGETDGQLPGGVIASAVTTPHPTLSNITVEWAIQGDDNLNSTVRVRYRKKGKLSWTLGMPLRRIPAGTLEGFSWTNRHSGSVFDVDPGTTYEVELWLRDPDGGCRIETVTVKTRPLPIPMANAPITKVTPSTLTASLAASKAGDILDLGASTYPGFVVPKDGTPGKPIVIRSTQSAKVQGTIDVRHREYVHIVGFTAPRIRFGLSKHVSIMKNTISLVGTFDGIGAWKRAEDAYIADNTVAGTTTWIEAAMGAHGQNSGEGILVTGPGHVITHNKVTGCRDNISFLEGKGEAFDQYSIDVIENDIDVATDDGVEADFCAHNCRIMRNRFTNVFIAMSSQPGLGGPTYFIRNVVYNNVFNAVFKLNRGSIGDVALHNTVVKGGDALAGTPGQTHYRQYFRNNLFLGGKGGTYNGWSSGDGKIVYMPFAAIDGSYDYDGFGSQAGNYGGKIGSVSFANMNELRSKTTEKHATKVDLSIFAKTISLPNPPFPQKSVPDLRLKAGAGAIDKGVVIPGINGNYAGAAPDLGAYEAGKALPAYGPRP